MRQRRCCVLDSILVCSLVIGALLVFGARADRLEIQGDESRYMWAGRYFEYLFVQRDLTRAEWGDNHWTHTQPMLANYLIGGWLWARGYSAEGAMASYDWSKGWWENLRAGQVPSKTVLAEARIPMVVLAASAISLLYVLGRVLGCPIAGFIAAVLALGSPLVQIELIQARSEAPLAFLLLLGLLLVVLGARQGRNGDLPLRWAVFAGAALGLGIATKLTAVLSLGAVGVWAALMALMAAWQSRSAGLTVCLGRAYSHLRGWALILGIAFGVFVLSNPHLYPDPLSHTAHLFQRRAQEMREQQRRRPELAIENSVDRAAYVVNLSLVQGTLTGSLGVVSEILLALAGLTVLLVRTWRGWRRTAQIPAEGLVLVTVLTYFGGLTAGLSLAYPRYILPTLLLGTLLSGLGAATLLNQVAGFGRAMQRRGSPAQVRVPQG